MSTKILDIAVPVAREGWFTEHPTSGLQVQVVTREDYDHLRNSAFKLLQECQLTLEHSDPPKGGYTRNLIGRIKRFTNKAKQ